MRRAVRRLTADSAYIALSLGSLYIAALVAFSQSVSQLFGRLDRMVLVGELPTRALQVVTAARSLEATQSRGLKLGLAAPRFAAYWGLNSSAVNSSAVNASGAAASTLGSAQPASQAAVGAAVAKGMLASIERLDFLLRGAYVGFPGGVAPAAGVGAAFEAGLPAWLALDSSWASQVHSSSDAAAAAPDGDPTLWRASRLFLTAGREVAAGSGAGWGNLTQSPYWAYLLQNGPQGVAPSLGSLLQLEAAAAHRQLAAVLGAQLAILVATAGVFLAVSTHLVRLLRAVEGERMRVLGIFLAVPQAALARLATRPVALLGEGDRDEEEDSDDGDDPNWQQQRASARARTSDPGGGGLARQRVSGPRVPPGLELGALAPISEHPHAPRNAPPVPPRFGRPVTEAAEDLVRPDRLGRPTEASEPADTSASHAVAPSAWALPREPQPPPLGRGNSTANKRGNLVARQAVQWGQLVADEPLPEKQQLSKQASSAGIAAAKGSRPLKDAPLQRKGNARRRRRIAAHNHRRALRFIVPCVLCASMLLIGFGIAYSRLTATAHAVSSASVALQGIALMHKARCLPRRRARPAAATALQTHTARTGSRPPYPPAGPVL